MFLPLKPETDPFVLFDKWYKHAEKKGLLRRFLSAVFPPSTLHQPDSMTLSTVTKDCKPSARIVLIKSYSSDGFVFFTNYTSNKAKELEANPYAALTFHWGLPERQVRIEGMLKKVSYEESDAYWSSRPRGSQLSALASHQSTVVESREYLVKKVEEAEGKFKDQKIACPEFWGGYRLCPDMIEFWEGKVNRLHDRFRYTRKPGGWEILRLAP